MKKIGIIIGSTRPGRRSPLIAEWFAKNLPQAELTYDVIDLADFDLPFLDESAMPQTGIYQHDTTKRWSEKIATYAGFIFIVPQYNWGYPAVLKNALDYLYREWQGKPACLVTFGGHGGSQAQIALRLVMQGLKMPVLSVAPMITLSPSASTTEALNTLDAYEHLLPALVAEFKRYLN